MLAHRAVRLPGELADAALAQIRLDRNLAAVADGLGNDARGVLRTVVRARHQTRRREMARDGEPGLARLLDAHLGEQDVGIGREALRAIPLALTVAKQDQIGS